MFILQIVSDFIVQVSSNEASSSAGIICCFMSNERSFANLVIDLDDKIELLFKNSFFQIVLYLVSISNKICPTVDQMNNIMVQSITIITIIPYYVE